MDLLQAAIQFTASKGRGMSSSGKYSHKMVRLGFGGYAAGNNVKGKMIQELADQALAEHADWQLVSVAAYDDHILLFFTRAA